MTRSFKPIVFPAIIRLSAGCATGPEPGTPLPLERRGEEIVAAGQYFRTGTPVVLWLDPGGYDAYRTERRSGPPEEARFREGGPGPSSRNRYNLRRAGIRSGARFETTPNPLAFLLAAGFFGGIININH